MSTATEPLPVELEDRIIDLNADQFLGAVDAGLFPAGSRLYLRDGRVVERRTPDGLKDRIVDLNADQFLGMVEAGLFPDDSRVYLWGGRIVEKMSKSIPHALTSRRVAGILGGYLPAGWIFSHENPVRLDDRHLPLPDMAIIRGPFDLYEREYRHPTVADVGLVIEIAYSSLSRDLGPRAEVLARNGVPSYWVLDVVGRRAVEHRGPTVLDGVGTYAHVRALIKGDEIPLILDGGQVALIPVAEFLP